ncbi:TetR/AcrR family transcriptional regulator [Streptomyces sp. NPDC055815]
MAGKANHTERPARMSLRERNRLRTRRELLDAALEVFAESGYGSATVENIALQAGVSKVTLYTYFPEGREELFRELYEEVNSELIEKATAIYEADGDFATHVLELTEALLELGERPLIGRFYSIDDPALDEALNPVRGHASRVCVELISGDLEAAQRAGTVKAVAPAGAIAELLVGSLRSALSRVARDRGTSTEIVSAMEALVRGL